MFKLEPRPQASAFWSLASPLLALAITVVIGVIIFLALGKDPMRGLQVFFHEPLRSRYAIGELVVSEELDELFEVSDRLHVIAKGRLSPSIPRDQATVEQIGEWMSGLWGHDHAEAAREAANV